MRRIAATRVASGLSQPLYVTAAPGDTSRLFIVEKTGTIKILDLNTGTVLATPFLTVPVDTASERGLLGLAFDPDYATNGAFYVYATSSRARRTTKCGATTCRAIPIVAAGGPRPHPRSSAPSTNGNHKAGWLGFGPDGYLYIASGEGGVPANAQDTTNLLGKILRIDVDPVAPGYRFPPTTRSSAGRRRARRDLRARPAQSMARELRSVLATFFIADVGGRSFEEINLGQNGANYGWPMPKGRAPIR